MWFAAASFQFAWRFVANSFLMKEQSLLCAVSCFISAVFTGLFGRDWRTWRLLCNLCLELCMYIRDVVCILSVRLEIVANSFLGKEQSLLCVVSCFMSAVFAGLFWRHWRTWRLLCNLFLEVCMYIGDVVCALSVRLGICSKLFSEERTKPFVCC